MAEDKTFRYGLIVLGFFLVTIGMFIMSVDKPQVYITFCTLGVLTTAAGTIWSMCQCYPKFTFVPMETETEKFLSHKPAVSIENEIPEKSCSQTVYTSQEEANVYEKSLPSYEQIQMKAEDSVERLGAQTAPLLGDCELKTGGSTHLFVQAKAEIHRLSENDGETPRDPAPQMVPATISSPSKRPRSAAPLASFQEDVDPPSSEGSTTSSSQFLGGSTYSLRNSLPSQGQPEKHGSEPPHYEDFALIDSLLVERRNLSQEPTLALSQNYLSATASPSHFAMAPGPGSKVADSREIQCVEEEDDMYYGLKEGPENLLIAEDFVFEPET